MKYNSVKPGKQNQERIYAISVVLEEPGNHFIAICGKGLVQEPIQEVNLNCSAQIVNFIFILVFLRKA